jgi:DNA-binding NtrC family response regulator
VNPVSGAEWLTSAAPCARAQVRVLVPAAAETRDHEICQALARWPAPTMAVFEARAMSLDGTLVERCQDFVLWPCAHDELALRLHRLAAAPPAAPEDAITQALRDEFARMNLVGGSPAFLGALALIKKIARCEAPVLIEGETGTGKELAARAIHYLGARRDYPFIPVNCGAVPDNLLENELYGHERGAFTDAKDAQPGLVAQADGGTLFLDEIDTLSAKGQVALLRFLQDQRYQPLGARQMRQANVRVVAGSNAALDERVNAGAFRQDLLYRLRILLLRLPPLRERTGDARLLAEHFMQRYSVQYRRNPKSMDPSLLRWLERHSWPGNVRELESLILRELLLTDEPIMRLNAVVTTTERRRDLADRRLAFTAADRFQEAKRRTVAEFERAFLYWALDQANGNVTLAAERAGKERRAFGKLLKKHGIDPGRNRPGP